MNRKFTNFKLNILVALFAAASAFATSGTWTGAGADNLFINATNWSASPAPTNTADVVSFDGTGNNAKAALISISTAIGGSSAGDGSSLVLLSGQTSAVGFTNTASGLWRLGTNGISVAAGAGPLTLNGSASKLFQITLGGNLSTTNYAIVNSNTPGVNPITFGPNLFFVRANSSRILGIDGPGDVTISGRILCTSANNSLSVAKSGTGTLTLSGDNTNTNGVSGGLPLRGVTLNAGNLNINNPGALGTNDPGHDGTFTINGGTIGNTSGADIAIKFPVPQAWNGDFTYAGTYGLNLSSGAVTLSANRQVAVISNTLTVGGVISGSGFSLAKVGNGTLVLSGANTYSGNTTVSNGTLVVGGAGTLGGGLYTGNIINKGTFNFASSSSQSLFGVISGTGSLIQSGTNVLTLYGINTYTGNTTVSAGTLAVEQASLATNSTVSISNGAVLQLDFATTNQVAALVLNGVTQPNGVYGSSTPGGYIAGTGFLQVAPVGPTGPANLTNSVSGNQLSLSWPSGQGWKLQIQTNSLSTGLGTNWTYITDGSVTSTNITIVPTLPSVFFRLVYP
jgi:autotransporter-associated beta strand protein